MTVLPFSGRLRDSRPWFVCLGLILIACRHAGPTATADDAVDSARQGVAAGVQDNRPPANTRALFEKAYVGGWRVSPFNDQGSAAFAKGEYLVRAGSPMSGITWTKEFPRTNYEVTLEAQRVEGGDFFCAMTFPVGDEFCTFIIGGWGGGLVGLSSLNGHDASENETTAFDQFDDGRWYKIRLLVSDLEIQGWIDGERYFRVLRDEHDFSIRFEVNESRPFGLATYHTTARYRNLLLREIDPPVIHPGTLHAELGVPYASTNHSRQRLDLYLPAKRKYRTPLPVIMAIHGGAWMRGDKTQTREFLEPYVETGRYAGVSINYRLSQDAKWPAQFEDCQSAIRWIRLHAERFGLDPKRIAVVGHSAGGHLAAMLGVADRVVDQSPTPPAADERSTRVACVVNYYGPSDLPTIGDYPSKIDHNSEDSPEGRLIGGRIPQLRQAALSASPAHYASGDDAPMLLIHGDEDQIVPYQQSVLLHTRLRSVGAIAKLVTINGGGHGGFDGPDLQGVVYQFLEKHLHDVHAKIADQTMLPNQSRNTSP